MTIPQQCILGATGQPALVPQGSCTLAYYRGSVYSTSSESLDLLEPDPGSAYVLTVPEDDWASRWNAEACRAYVIPRHVRVPEFPVWRFRGTADVPGLGAVVALSAWPPQDRGDAGDEAQECGVLEIAHNWPVLFTQEVVWRTADLPQWEPNVVLGEPDDGSGDD